MLLLRRIHRKSCVKAQGKYTCPGGGTPHELHAGRASTTARSCPCSSPPLGPPARGGTLARRRRFCSVGQGPPHGQRGVSGTSDPPALLAGGSRGLPAPQRLRMGAVMIVMHHLAAARHINLLASPRRPDEVIRVDAVRNPPVAHLRVGAGAGGGGVAHGTAGVSRAD